MRRRAVIYLCVLAGALGAIWLPISAQGPGARGVERIAGNDARAREVLVKFRLVAARAHGPRRQLRADGDADDLRFPDRPRRHVSPSSARVFAKRRIAHKAARGPRRRRIRRAELHHPDRRAAQRSVVRSALGSPQHRPDRSTSFPASPAPTSMRCRRGTDSVGSTAHVVAVIDTGIDYTHPDLAANMWSAPAAFTVNVGGAVDHLRGGHARLQRHHPTCNPMDDHHHGTHVVRHHRRRRRQRDRRGGRQLDGPDDGHQVHRRDRQRHDRRRDRGDRVCDRRQAGVRRDRRRQHPRAVEQLGRAGVLAGAAR